MSPVSAAVSAGRNGGPVGRTRSRTPDRLCAEAVSVAREAAEEAASPQPLGPYLGAVAEGDRLVTHLFGSEEPGYPGWRWGVTVTRASRAKQVTIDEVTLTPGPDALLAPEWVPWSERLRPGDLRPGDLLPVEFDDLRLEPGYAIAAGEEPTEAQRAAAAAEAAAAEAGAAEAGAEPAGPPSRGAIAEAAAAEAGAAEAGAEPAGPPSRGAIAEVAAQLGLGRRRVLSWFGLSEAAERWAEEFGPQTPMAESAPASCVSCGFLMPVAGALRQAFGVCANEFSPADGRVVSLSYGCGAHSEAAGAPKPESPAQPVIDHLGADPL